MTDDPTGPGSPQPPPPPPPPPPRAADESASGNVWSIAAIVLGILGFLLIPIIFGPVALVAGGVAKWKRERLSTWGLAFAAGGLIAGTLLNVLLYSQRN